MQSLIIRLSTALLAVFTLSCSYTATGQYCQPSYSTECSTSNVYISQVETINGFSNFQHQTGCTNGGYADYSTNLSYRAHQYATNEIDVKVKIESPSGYTSILKIYIDWNHDGKFDTSANSTEYIKPANTNDQIATTPGQTLSIRVAVPITARSGLTRMRVRVGSLGSIYDASMNACNISTYGETEDYTFGVYNFCKELDTVMVNNRTLNSALLSWAHKSNVRFYEYYIKDTLQFPPNLISNNLITSTQINAQGLICSKDYYLFVRAICDTTGDTTNWEYSPWYIRKFRVTECCGTPVPKVVAMQDTAVKIAWDTIGNADKYEYSITTTANPVTYNTNMTNNNSFIKSGLQPFSQYWVHVRTLCGQSKSLWSSISFRTYPLSIESMPVSKEIHIYPNPTDDVLYIDIEEKGTVTITDVTGKIVHRSIVKEHTSISTAGWPAGTYTLQHVNKDRVLSRKVVKQ